MLVAGVGWRGQEYLVVVVDSGSRSVVRHATFRADQLDEMIALLRAPGDDLHCVIDTASGVLEHLVGAGLQVFRADPWSVERLRGGSAEPGSLARCWWSKPFELTKLTVEDGALSGRQPGVRAAIERCVDVERELTAAGQWFSQGAGSTRQIALTFDDGPGPFTGQVLDVLARYGVVATFFCIGLHAHADPRMVQRIVDEGHLVANHTWSHPYLPDLTRHELADQLEQTSAAIARVTGAPPALFRPPYGGRSPEVMEGLAESGMVTALWDVDALDWAMPGQATIERTVIEQAGPGSVVLMHDGGADRSQTVAALPRIIERFGSDDYSFVSVDRLARAAP